MSIPWVPYLPVVILPLVLFANVLFTGKALYWGTPELQFIPWRALAWESLKQGILPLWNPLNGMGAPLLANYQLALFYPPGWLLYGFAALGGIPWMAWAHTLLVVLHLIWAGLGMVYLGRRLGFGPLAQAISGMSFALCGYLVARVGFFSIIWTAAWLPWVILSASRIAIPGREPESGNHSVPVSLIACLTLMLLAGHAQVSWYTLILAGAWVLVGGWQRQGFRTAVTALGRYAAAVAAAVLLAAVQLIPTGEYLLQSQRAATVDYETAMAYSFWPWRLLTLIAPDLFGNPGFGTYWGYASHWEDAIYIGLLPLILVVLTIPLALGKAPAGSKRAQAAGLARFLWVFAILSVLLALGKNTPIFPFLYRMVLTFDMFHAPARYLIWLEFALCLLAGMAVEHWHTPSGRGLYWLRLATAGGAAITLGAFLTWRFLTGVSPTFIGAMALTGLWALGTGLLTLFMPGEGAPRRRLWIGLVIAWVGLDLLVANWVINPAVERTFYAPDLGQAPWVSNVTPGHRIYVSQGDDYRLKYRRFLRFDDYRPLEDALNIRRALLPNLNLLVGIPSANNFDPLVPGAYAMWVQRLEGLSPEEKAPWLALMDVAGLEQVDVQEPLGVKLESVPGAQRFRWYSTAVAVADSSQAWRQLEAEMALTPAGEVPERLIVEGVPVDAATLDNPPGMAQIRLVEDRADRVVVEVTAEEPGWLFMADSWYPGWQASVDQEQTPLYRVDYLFRAVWLPAGRHEVVFAYRPASFRAGLGLSLAGGLSVLLWLNRRRWWKRTTQAPEQQG